MMKTAISIPDDIFSAAESAAKKLGVSRSELYTNAVREFLERHGRDEITERLNEIYGSRTAELTIDKHLAEMQTASLPHEDW